MGANLIDAGGLRIEIKNSGHQQVAGFLQGLSSYPSSAGGR
jgi:hypothetical protein